MRRRAIIALCFGLLAAPVAGVAQVQDPNLVNPWGISESSTSPFWISDNNAGVSTLYNVPGASNTPVSINPLVVSIPTPGNPLGSSGTPTGTVFNLDQGATGQGVVPYLPLNELGRRTPPATQGGGGR